MKKFLMLVCEAFAFVVTFPGLMARELSHRLICRLLGVRKVGGRYYQLAPGAGGAVLQAPISDWNTLPLVWGPFIIHSLLVVVFGLAPILKLYDLNSRLDPLDYILLWITFTIGLLAFPSKSATQVVDERFRSTKSPRFRAACVGTLAFARLTALAFIFNYYILFLPVLVYLMLLILLANWVLGKIVIGF